MEALKIHGEGRIGQIESKTLDSGATLTTFTLATSKPAFTTKEGKQIAEKTNWYNCVAWRGTGDVIAKYFNKRYQIIITDAILKHEQITDKDGKKRKSYKVVVNDFGFGAKKKGGENTEAVTEAEPNPAESLNPAAVPDDLPF